MKKQPLSAGFHDGHEKETHLLDYFQVLRRRWKVALLISLLILAGASAYILTRTPIFRASTTLSVTDNPSDKLINTPFLDQGLDLRADLRLIHSRSLAEKVVETLNLHWHVAEVAPGFDVEILEFKLPDGLAAVQLEMTSPEAFVVRDGHGQALGSGRTGELLESDGLVLRVAVIKARAGDRMVFERLSASVALGQVINRIRASVGDNGSNIIQINVEHKNPVLARNIADAAALAYQHQRVEGKTREAALMIEFIDSQLSGLREQVEASERELQTFKISSGLKNLSLEGEQAVDQVVTLEREKAELSLKSKRIEIFLNNASSRTRYFTSVEDIPGVSEVQTASVELSAKREDLLENFTEAHPEVLALEEQLAQMAQRVIRSCRLETRRIDQRIKIIETRLSESDASLGDVPQEQLELARMTRSNKVNSDLYMSLLQKKQETEISLATTTSNVEIIDPAYLPQKPIRPNKPKLFLMSIFVGLLTGIGCTFLLEYFDQTIRDLEDVREYLDLPVLATIPRIDLADQGADEPSKQLALTLAPKSPAVEAFRALRTSLHFATTKGQGKVIMITSSIPGEGKSTISGNLAGVFAQSGARVLLVGCDLRRPSLSEMFEQNTAPGLTELLVDGDTKALRRTQIQKLDFIPGGTIPPNPSELLGSKRMAKLIEQMRDRYDYIILDAPPVLPVTDAQVLSKLVDLTAVVVEACRINHKAAQRMLQTMNSVEARIAGVILNDKSGTAAKYYGSYNYYGHKKYGGYYGESTPVEKPGALQKFWEKLNS